MAEVTEQGFVLLCRPPLPLSPHQRVPPTLCQVSQLSRLPAKRGRPPRHTERTLEDCLNALFPPRAVPSLGAKRLRPSEDRMRSRHWSPNPGDGDLLVLYGKGEAAGPAVWMLLPARPQEHWWVRYESRHSSSALWRVSEQPPGPRRPRTDVPDTR